MFQFSVEGFSVGRPTPDRSKKSFFIFETFFDRNRSSFVANRFYKFRHVSVVLNQRSDPCFGFGHRSGLEDFLAQPEPQSFGGFDGSAGQQHFESAVAADETDLHKKKLFFFFILKFQFGNKYFFFQFPSSNVVGTTLGVPENLDFASFLKFSSLNSETNIIFFILFKFKYSMNNIVKGYQKIWMFDTFLQH